MPTEELMVYKQPKAKLRNKVRKWNFIPFTNSARQDNAQFYHWRCANKEEAEYPFAKYNKVIFLFLTLIQN